MHRFLPVLVFVLVFLAVGVLVKTTFFKSQPPHVLHPQQLLAKEGENGSDSGSSGSGSSGSESRSNDDNDDENQSGSSGSSSSGSGTSGSGTSTTPKVSVPVDGSAKSGPSRVRIEAKDENEVKDEVEIEDVDLDENEDVDLENEAGVIRIRIRSPEATVTSRVSGKAEEKFEFKVKDGKTVLKFEKEGVGKIEIKVRGDRFEIKQRGSAEVLLSHFPLTFDNQTNQLIVKTPNGDVPIAVLPQQAVDNMQNQGLLEIIERLEVEVDEGVNTANKVVIKARGINMERFLGLLPLAVSETVNIDPETGQVVAVEKPFPFNILDLLFF